MLAPTGLPFTLRAGWFMVQRSDFSMAKIQGASGLALGPCVLFSVVALLAGFLVSGLAVAWVRGCGCRLMLFIFWWGGWLLAGLLAAWGGNQSSGRNFSVEHPQQLPRHVCRYLIWGGDGGSHKSGPKREICQKPPLVTN